MIIINDSVFTDPQQIQERINVFVTYVNQCLRENSRKEKDNKEETA